MKRWFVYILLLFIVIIRLIFYVNQSESNVLVVPTTHQAIDTRTDEIISKRVVLSFVDGLKFYFWGYDGLGVYNMKNYELTIYPFEVFGDELILSRLKNDTSKIIVNQKKSLSEFSLEEQQQINKLFLQSDDVEVFYSPWLKPKSEATFIDIEKKFILSNNVKSVKNTENKIYIYNEHGYIIINKFTKGISAYFSESIAGKKVRDSLISNFKYAYGEQFQLLDSLNLLDKNERNILMDLRDKNK